LRIKGAHCFLKHFSMSWCGCPREVIGNAFPLKLQRAALFRARQLVSARCRRGHSHGRPGRVVLLRFNGL
jgi:hypothetical protein